MSELDRQLNALESRITEAERLIRALGQENAKLREALAAKPAGGAESGSEEAAKRSYRLVALEAERDEVRSRLKTLIEAL